MTWKDIKEKRAENEKKPRPKNEEAKVKRIETNSSLSCFRACRKKYKHQYIDLLTDTEEKEYFSHGRLGHEALAEYYQAMIDYPDQANRPMVRAMEVLQLPDNADDITIIRHKKITSLISGYHKYYHDDQFKPVMVEAEFKVPIINPASGHPSTTMSLAGAIDLLADHTSGKWLMDHKFMSQPGERSYWQINSQMDIYINAVTQQGHDVKGIIWNILRTPQIRQKKNESVEEFCERLDADISERPDFYFHRFVIPRWREDIKEAQQELWEQHHTLQDAVSKGSFYKNPNQCRSLYGMCQFLPICNGVDYELAGFKKKEKKHQELESSF